MDKHSLIQKIKALEGLTNDEKSDLINLLNQTKKYGLVWEDKPEDVERELLTKLPVLIEVPDRRILAKDLPQSNLEVNRHSEPAPATLFDNTENRTLAEVTTSNVVNNKDAPNHILIEGDNLHALTALTFTHKGKIDVIYIDPPYNTGNKDFKYNDSFVDKEDNYRHSKWLSFMHKRMQIAHRLLREEGVVFISIDENEIAQLKLLCEDIFTSSNYIAELPTIMNLKGNQDQFAFAGTHEYTIVFAKNKLMFNPSAFNFNEDELEDWDEDEIGLFKKGAPMRATGSEANREDRPLMFYPIIIDQNNNSFTITKEEHSYIYDAKKKEFDDNHLRDLIMKYSDMGYDVVLPTVDENQYGRWRWGYNDNTISRLSYDVIVTRTRQGISLYKKQRPELGDLPTKKPKSIFYKPEYSSGNGTAQLKNIFNDKRFNNPKPLDLIKDFLVIGSKRNSLILDFFAGSGTTLHATMQLNAEDGGNRQCILVTNNENNICEEVTFERNKRVIQGYTNSKGVQVDGLTNNNLRYYKTSFVPSAKTEVNRRQLTKASIEILQIKENCYTDITVANGFDHAKCGIFTNKAGKYLVIVYHSRKQHEVVANLCQFIQNIPDLNEKVRVYAFSPETEVLVDDFYSVADKITAVPLPDAIYNAYRATLKTLKLEKKKFAKPIGEPEVIGIGDSEDSEVENEFELFDQNAEELL